MDYVHEYLSIFASNSIHVPVLCTSANCTPSDGLISSPMSLKRPQSTDAPFDDISEARRKRSRNDHSDSGALAVTPLSHPGSNPLPFGGLYPTQPHLARPQGWTDRVFEAAYDPARDVAYQHGQDFGKRLRLLGFFFPHRQHQQTLQPTVGLPTITIQ